MENYIINGRIDIDLCDLIIENYEDNFRDHSHYDKTRGYHRISNRQMNPLLMRQYIKELINMEGRYRDTFPHINQGTKWGITSPFNIQKYDPGEAYNPIHIECGGPRKDKMVRILAFTTYLNSIETGGETEFINQNIKVHPIKGNTILWPAGWTHPHRGIPAPNETKYIVTGWFSYHHRC